MSQNKDVDRFTKKWGIPDRSIDQAIDLWVQTFLAVAAKPTATINQAIGWANEAVDAFEEKFPRVEASE